MRATLRANHGSCASWRAVLRRRAAGAPAGRRGTRPANATARRSGSAARRRARGGSPASHRSRRTSRGSATCRRRRRVAPSRGCRRGPVRSDGRRRRTARRSGRRPRRGRASENARDVAHPVGDTGARRGWRGTRRGPSPPRREALDLLRAAVVAGVRVDGDDLGAGGRGRRPARSSSGRGSCRSRRSRRRPGSAAAASYSRAPWSVDSQPSTPPIGGQHGLETTLRHWHVHPQPRTRRPRPRRAAAAPGHWRRSPRALRRWPCSSTST